MMEYKGYHAAISYSQEDDLFYGKVLGIQDALYFHGSSVTELKAMFKQSVDNYLDMCKSTGKTPDKEYKGVFNVRISPQLHKKASLMAAMAGMTLNEFVAKSIADRCSVSITKGSQGT